MKIDLKINAWRLSKEGLIEIMEAYPRGRLHPDGIAYTVHLTRGMEHVDNTGLEITFFVENDVMDYAKGLVHKGDEEE